MISNVCTVADGSLVVTKGKEDIFQNFLVLIDLALIVKVVYLQEHSGSVIECLIRQC